MFDETNLSLVRTITSHAVVNRKKKNEGLCQVNLIKACLRLADELSKEQNCNPGLSFHLIVFHIVDELLRSCLSRGICSIGFH